MPKRFQYRRGVSLPENTVYVGRPSKWGNPFKVGASGTETNELAVSAFKEYIIDTDLAKQAKAELTGKDLACWCKLDDVCHADVLLDIANK